MSSSLAGAVRGASVMVAPSLVLGGLAAASAASCMRSVARGRVPPAPAMLGAALTMLYVLKVRGWMSDWGATDAEARDPLPGDDLVPRAVMQSTMAVTIDALPEDVWPWLAQIGQERGGFYSYEWLENLAGCRMVNTDAIHPEWQHRVVGDLVYLHPLNGLAVTRFEPGRMLALEGWGAFILEPAPGSRTRLLVRGRTPPRLAAIVSAVLIEVPHFVMQRRMLLGIRERAERHVGSQG